jgi:DegT/DnrJ/EryC1/StrS aminotransferase family
VIQAAGAKTVFADVERRTLNLDPDSVAAHITSRAKAILPGCPQKLPFIGSWLFTEAPDICGMSLQG